MEKLLPRLEGMLEQRPSPEVAGRIEVLTQELLTCAEGRQTETIEL